MMENIFSLFWKVFIKWYNNFNNMNKNIQNLKISDATIQNWKRLNKNLDNSSFFSRANKTQSRKKIIPKEYLKFEDEIDLLLDEINSEESIETTVNSLILKYLFDLKLIFKINGEFSSKNKYIDSFISSFNNDFYEIKFNFDKFFNIDLIGYIYQILKLEGDKNISGSYYTPSNIVYKMIENIDFENKKVCDPCCGSGGFLNVIAKTSNIKPENIFGYDTDKIAVKIMKSNLFAIFKDFVFSPNIFCEDFLKVENDEKFNLIITNPPWGAYIKDEYKEFKEIKSKESFSYFIYKSIMKIKDIGKIIFLLPTSFLNVRTHKDIRKYIIESTTIKKIELFKKPFTSVLTDAISIELDKSNSDKISIINGDSEYKISYDRYKNDNDYVFSLFDDFKNSIIKKIEKVPHFRLSDSKFALGIVTGNNKKMLLDNNNENTMPIYIGKDIKKYFASSPKKFIIYDRKKFQQVASDEFYFAPEKLIYKFISNKKLIFSYDDKKTLVLNSANILIPYKIPINIKALCVLLNSNILNFYFKNKINQIKTLKYDLQNIPIPIIDKKTENLFTDFLDQGIFDESRIQSIIYNLYDFLSDEIKIIEGDLKNGKA